MFDIYVINLEERTDRWEKIQKTFSQFNLIRFNAIKHNKGSIGCFKSHMEIIKMAKDKGLKNVFVIEDDCIPFIPIYSYIDNKPIQNYTEIQKEIESNFASRICKVKEYLDSNDSWDIYLGGSNKISHEDIITKINYKTENFVMTKKGFMAHMICYNSKVYDFYLENYNNSHIPIDALWHGNLNALVSVPFISGQDDGFSNIVKVPVSYQGRTTNCNNLLVNYIKNSPNK